MIYRVEIRFDVEADSYEEAATKADALTPFGDITAIFDEDFNEENDGD